jgi:Arc/MetJ-type ribon-helix-helix transcriptional regulator
MASITSVLPEHQRRWIKHEVESGRCESEMAVIVDAVRRAKESSYRWEEDEDLLEAIAEADRGDVVEWSEDLFKKLSDRAHENSRLGHKVSYDIKY